MRQQMLIVSGFAIDAVVEHGDHVFVRMLVEMMDLIALVENIGEEIWCRGIDDC
jgi:hypothetical protein